MTPRQVAAFTDTLPAPCSSSGQDAGLSSRQHGFDSRTGYFRRGIAPTVDRRLLDVFTVAGWLALIVAAVR